jgi:hypothetical protein
VEVCGAHQVSTTQSLLKAHSKLLAVDEFLDILCGVVDAKTLSKFVKFAISIPIYGIYE